MFLVPLLNPKFAVGLAARVREFRVRGTSPAALRLRGYAVSPGALRRGLIAGSAWGLVTGALIVAVGAWECGGICLPDAALTAAFSLAAGIATIGPLAAFGARG